MLPVLSSSSSTDRFDRLAKLYGDVLTDPVVVSSDGEISDEVQCVTDDDNDDNDDEGDGEDEATAEVRTLAKHGSFLDDFNSETMQFERLYPDGKQVLGELCEGPNGFAVVGFPGEEPKETEVPNIVVKKVMMKRPAAAVAPDEPDQDCSDDKCPIADLIRIRPAACTEHKRPAAGHKSSERHRLYSKTYHSTKLSLLRNNPGMSADEAKRGAQEAARRACNERFGS